MYIYHYTTIKALYGIMKNKEFWWGNTSSMNDRNERLEFIGRITGAVREDFGPSEKCDEFCRHIEAEASTDFPFAMCFSTQAEDASQWERYADRAQGVCLKINSEVFASLLEGCNVVFNNVYYDFDVRNHRYYPLINSYFTDGSIHGEAGIYDLESLASHILASAPIYKNHSFWGESERRVYTLLGLPFCDNPDTYRYDYESKDNEIKRYLKIRYDLLCLKKGIKPDDMIEEVVIGPRGRQNIEELKAFCIDMGFPGLADNIRLSNCPLR